MLRFKIKNIKVTEKIYNQLFFGRQIKYHQVFKDFKLKANEGYLNTKHKPVNKALKEFINLYKVKEYYFIDNNTKDYWDDSIQIWYKN